MEVIVDKKRYLLLALSSFSLCAMHELQVVVDKNTSENDTSIKRASSSNESNIQSPQSSTFHILLPNASANDLDNSDMQDALDTVRKRISQRVVLERDLLSQRTTTDVMQLARSLGISKGTDSSDDDSHDSEASKKTSSEIIAYSRAIYNVLVSQEVSYRDDKRRTDGELERQRCHTRWGYLIGLCGMLFGGIGSVLGIIATVG